MAVFGLVLHPERSEALAMAHDINLFLTASGHETRLLPEDAARAALPTAAVDPERFTTGLDAVVSLGGDGTMLRSIALLEGAAVPVIGVNLGQLGYLTEVEPAGAHEALLQFLRGEHETEERMLLDVTVGRGRGVDEDAARSLALNEAVLEKTLSGHTVRLDVSIDGRLFTPYETDGLIVGTPTGSTAYAFSVRGPIISPTHRSILIAPVSPHMLFDRTLVLEPETIVEVAVAGHRPATLTVDGREVGRLEVGDSLRCTAATSTAHLATFGPRDFQRILKAKFGLSDR